MADRAGAADPGGTVPEDSGGNQSSSRDAFNGVPSGTVNTSSDADTAESTRMFRYVKVVSPENIPRCFAAAFSLPGELCPSSSGGPIPPRAASRQRAPAVAPPTNDAGRSASARAISRVRALPKCVTSPRSPSSPHLRCSRAPRAPDSRARRSTDRRCGRTTATRSWPRPTRQPRQREPGSRPAVWHTRCRCTGRARRRHSRGRRREGRRRARPRHRRTSSTCPTT